MGKDTCTQARTGKQTDKFNHVQPRHLSRQVHTSRIRIHKEGRCKNYAQQSEISGASSQFRPQLRAPPLQRSSTPRISSLAPEKNCMDRTQATS
uniref:Uncharacterized protein n=1 Tax=Arundo donax TaxID=35708 RepID=A0A0A9DQE4_ARUDO